mgnify:CR=1 FL=1
MNNKMKRTNKIKGQYKYDNQCRIAQLKLFADTQSITILAGEMRQTCTVESSAVW